MLDFGGQCGQESSACSGPHQFLFHVPGDGRKSYFLRRKFYSFQIHNYPSVNTTLISELAIYFLVSWILIFLMNKEKLRSCSAWAMLKHNLIHIDWENEVIVISMSLFLLDHNMSNTNNMSCYRTYNQNQLQQTKERNPDTWYVKLTNCWMTRVKFPSRIFSTFLQSIILQH